MRCRIPIRSLTLAPGAPWAAYSWLFELVLSGFYRIAGLRGIVLYTALMSVAISWALLRMLSRYVSPLLAAALTRLGLFLTYPLLWPRPACSRFCFSFCSWITC